MWHFFHQLASLPYFYRIAGTLIPWLAGIATLLLLGGLYMGLFVAPPDYQQGQSYRIIFVHVPSAWMSLFVYVLMAVAGAITLIWRIKLAVVIVASCAPLGASFTLLALITGALWGKPMWGTYWVWDARLTSELILLFLYLGVIGLQNAIKNPHTGTHAAAILVVVGVVNLPIIHYSVDWWTTLHQPATIAKFGAPSMHISMLLPLLIIAGGFKVYFFALLLLRARAEVLLRERNHHWVRALLAPPPKSGLSTG